MGRARVLVWCVVLLLCGGLACEEQASETTVDESPTVLPPAPPQPAASPSEAQPASPGATVAGLHTTLDMLARHTRALEARDALVAGNLLECKQAMGELARGGAGVGVKAALAPFLRQVSEASKAAARAADLTEAAQALGRAAVACGGCHREAGRGPEYPRAYEPDDFPDPVAHMWRHQWAVDRMWEGLAGPWEAAWQAGAAQLAEPPLKPSTFGVTQGDWKRFGKLARRVHALGGQAAAARSAAQRAELFGELLSTCGGCHAALGRGPSRSPQPPALPPDKPGGLAPPGGR